MNFRLTKILEISLGLEVQYTPKMLCCFFASEFYGVNDPSRNYDEFLSLSENSIEREIADAGCGVRW